MQNRTIQFEDVTDAMLSTAFNPGAPKTRSNLTPKTQGFLHIKPQV